MATRIQKSARKRKRGFLVNVRRRKPTSKSKHKSKNKKPHIVRRKRNILLPANPNSALERALDAMKGGFSQSAAAKSVGISSHRLARYRKKNTWSRRKQGLWIIRDRRPAEMQFASQGKQYSIAVPNRSKGAVGRYWNAINRFLDENKTKWLEPYSGRSIRDIYGKKHVFETDPNTLRMMDAIGDLQFLEIYANTAN